MYDKAFYIHSSDPYRKYIQPNVRSLLSGIYSCSHFENKHKPYTKKIQNDTCTYHNRRVCAIFGTYEQVGSRP